MYKRNEWNENEKFSLNKIAQDVLDMSKKSSPFFGHNIVETSKSSNIKSSCCIDTTKITADPCSNEIQTSCCIDTTKE